MANKPPFVGERVAFHEAFKDISRGVVKYKQAQYKKSGMHPIIDQGKDFIAGYTDDKKQLCTDTPAIVFGDHTRVVKYIEMPFAAGADGVKILKPLLPGNVRYWYHALRATRLKNLGYSRHFKLLKEKTFIVATEENQNAISNTLDEILAQIDLTGMQLALLDQLVKSRFVEMFVTSGIPNTNLHQCCANISGGMTPSTKRGDFYGGNVPFVKSGDIGDDYVSSGTLWLTETALNHTSAKLIPAGSVLIVTRSAMLLRKTATSIAANDLVINQDIKALEPSADYVSEYLLWAIRAKEQELLSKVISVSTSHIDINDLLSLPVPAAPLAHQQEFAEFAAQVDKSRFAATLTRTV